MREDCMPTGRWDLGKKKETENIKDPSLRAQLEIQLGKIETMRAEINTIKARLEGLQNSFDEYRELHLGSEMTNIFGPPTEEEKNLLLTGSIIYAVKSFRDRTGHQNLRQMRAWASHWRNLFKKENNPCTRHGERGCNESLIS